MNKKPILIVASLLVGLGILVPITQSGLRLKTKAAGSSTLGLTSTINTQTGKEFSVPLTLNPNGSLVTGVDIKLNYPTNLLTLTRIDPVPGQPTQLIFLPDLQTTLSNSQSGDISFSILAFNSQNLSPSTPLSGNTSLPLAVLSFKAISDGTAQVNFSFTPSSTTDSNVSISSNPPQDTLAAVTNLTANIAAIAPSPTNTPISTPIPTISLTPISSTPKPLNTPSPTKSPNTNTSPTPSVTPTTKTLQITASTIHNQDGSQLTTGNWVGTSGNSSSSYLALRFNNVSLPKNSKIISANLDLFSSKTQWISIQSQIFLDTTLPLSAYSTKSLPSNRTKSTSSVKHTSNSQWVGNRWYTYQDISLLIKEMVNSTTWTSGNSVGIIIKGTGAAWGRKFISNTQAPRLTITYTN